MGAIDGTHVPANVPVEIQGKFRGRKEGTTQNVLAAITVIAIIEEERNRIYIPREPRINAFAQREFYIDSLLNRGDRHCVEKIRMKPVVLYRLCDVLINHNLLRSTQNVSIREQVIVFL